MLTIVKLTAADTVETIDRILTNAPATIAADPAMLSICPANLNCSGAVNSQEFFDFLTAFFAGCS